MSDFVITDENNIEMITIVCGDVGCHHIANILGWCEGDRVKKNISDAKLKKILEIITSDNEI